VDNLIQELQEKLPVRLVYCFSFVGESVVLGHNGFMVIVEEGLWLSVY